jgi:hypothetical protein
MYDVKCLPEDEIWNDTVMHSRVMPERGLFMATVKYQLPLSANKNLPSEQFL